MLEPVRRRLLDINRDFYVQFARDFADARSTNQPSMRRVLELVSDGDSVLDVGCGDGRAARALDEMGRHCTYLGIDGSEAFVSLAAQRSTGMAHVTARFQVADIAQAHWAAAIPSQPFSSVFALAVLHHIPGSATRQRLFFELAALLAPEGKLILSTWQFLSSERLRRKIVPWNVVGLSDGDVDPGDHLLDWERGGHGLRYCHLIGRDELESLCLDAGLVAQETYLADRNLNLFMICRRRV